KLHPSPAVALRAASLARRQAEDSAPLPSTARADCAQARRVSSRNRRAAGCAALSILWMQRASSSRYASQAGTPSAARAPASGAATAAGERTGAGRWWRTSSWLQPAASAKATSRSRMRVLYQPMRPALSLCLCIGLAACSKSAPPKVEPPPDYLGVVSTASLDGAMARFGAYADAVSPGASAALRSDAATSLLATLVSARSLAGVAIDKPLHLVILDPKKHAKPLLLLAGGPEARKLKAGVGELETKVEGGRALIGAKAEVDATAAWAFAALADAPAAPTLRLDLGRLVDRYRPDIEAARKQLQPLLAQSPGAGKILEAEIDILTRLAAQTRELTVTVDATAQEAVLELALAPNPGSGMETFIKAQHPLSPAILGKLPNLDKAAYVLAGDY